MRFYNKIKQPQIFSVQYKNQSGLIDDYELYALSLKISKFMICVIYKLKSMINIQVELQSSF
jgi:hypothetical protein